MFASLKRLLGFLAAAALWTLGPTSIWSQPLNFSTLAGNAGYGSIDGFTNNARFNFLHGMTVDGSGNIYVADTQNSTIRRIDPTQLVSTFAGSAGSLGNSNGIGSAASFNSPQGVAVDSAGNIYVADSGNDLIRQITPAGMVSTIAGSAGVAGNTNGVGTNALFRLPGALAVDASTNVYVADTYNSTIRKLVFSGSNWVVTTIAGSPTTNGSVDGLNTNAFFFQPSGITVDSNQNLYVADTGNNAIRKIAFNGTNWVTTTIAHLTLPLDVSVDPAGKLYVACSDDTIQKVELQDTNWVANIIAGSPGISGSADGSGSARFNYPCGVMAHNGLIYVADSLNNTVRSVTTNGIVSTLAGLAGGPGFKNGAAMEAQFNSPTGVAVDNDKNIYVADSQNSTIRQIIPSGFVTTLAGVATNGPGNQDGISTNAAFNFPTAIAVDGNANVYVADSYNNEIRILTFASNHWAAATLAGRAGPLFRGNITNLVGGQTFVSTLLISSSVYQNYSRAFTNISGGVTNISIVITNVPFLTNVVGGHIQTNFLTTNIFALPPAPPLLDGFGTNALFNHPSGLVLDKNGSLYVADGGTNGVRLISPVGSVSTPAGFSGTYQVSATTLPFHSSAVALDAGGNIYVADAVNNTIREMPVGGPMVTIAGAPGFLGTADGTNNLARFASPSALAVDDHTNLYVTDAFSHIVRKISPSGSDWIVTTVGGWPNIPGYLDAVGQRARFNEPQGIAIDRDGTLYIGDTGNNTIRVGQASASAPVVLSFGRAGQQRIVLSWPASATGFQLESSTDLGTNAVWLPLAIQPSLLDTNLVITNDAAASATFYRLHRP